MTISRVTRLVVALLGLSVSSLGFAASDPPAAGVVTRAVPNETDWAVRMPADDKVAYRGLVSQDTSGPSGVAVMYPAPNLVGLFAAIAAHGLVSSSRQAKEKSRAQEEADKVLLPYQPLLDKVTHGLLAQRAFERMTRGAGKKVVEPNATVSNGWIIETAPVFSVTQDERALLLDNVIVVRAPGSPDVINYQNVVRVVSVPRPAAEQKAGIVEFWTADEGRMIAQESADLFAKSLDIVLADLARGPELSASAPKTVRYKLGGVESIERASLIEERCDRLTLRTLRGGLLSVPAPVSSCEGGQVADKPPTLTSGAVASQ